MVSELNYVQEANRTLSSNYPEIANRLMYEGMIDVLHGAIGIATEGGELLDAVKKHVFYGKPFDHVNAEEELGDVLWYVAIVARRLGVSMDRIMEKNIAKLRKRYPEKFTETAALNRDLDGERKILEGDKHEDGTVLSNRREEELNAARIRTSLADNL